MNKSEPDFSDSNRGKNEDSLNKIPGKDFVTECNQKKHRTLQNRFVFRSIQAKKIAGKVNYLPADSEIPLIEIQKSPI